MLPLSDTDSQLEQHREAATLSYRQHRYHDELVAVQRKLCRARQSETIVLRRQWLRWSVCSDSLRYRRRHFCRCAVSDHRAAESVRASDIRYNCGY